MKVLRYLKARLGESSTWAGVVTAATGASALNEPWSYVAMGAGVIMVLVPTSKGAAQ